MAIKHQLQTLLHTEMDRRDFLKYIGGILLAVIGATGLMKALFSEHAPRSGTAKRGGYGMSPPDNK